mmetsp:Transcript_121864/g.351825  ORF Transcript_121864/g.351825 Transcript_121864/m.351825 type:complete len:280 (-) Transcript_121864:397-1236(-)
MGCNSSQAPKPPGDGVKNAETATWATKTEVGPAGDLRGKNFSTSGGLRRAETSKMLVADADDESEIEIIYEGKAKHTGHGQLDGDHDLATPSNHKLQRGSPAANAQEAPHEGEAMQEAKAPVVELPPRQKEEAAKLAEQRKRFDNQRYQREHGGGGGEKIIPSGLTSPSSAPSSTVEEVPAGPAPPVAAVSTAASSQVVAHEAPRHELVLGLNLTDVPPHEGQGEPLFVETLPGGIGDDSPRAAVAAPIQNKNKHKHDFLDDDDEVFMKEILESVDVAA